MVLLNFGVLSIKKLIPVLSLGPQSVGADFTFHKTKHLFGIPEHASSLALKDTHTEYNDPYRLYNLDVFEYELDNPMALYGAVPFVISLNEKGSTGLFWYNPSETWIDVNKKVDFVGNQDRHTLTLV